MKNLCIIILTSFLFSCNSRQAQPTIRNERYGTDTFIVASSKPTNGPEYLVTLKGVKGSFLLAPVPGRNNLAKDCTITIIHLGPKIRTR